MKTCPNCGEKVKDGVPFCPKCGNAIAQSSTQSPSFIFKNGCKFYKSFDNGNDLLIYPITERFRAQARSNFKLDREEEILVIRDTSFWNDKNQGLVITNMGIRVITDNEKINDDTTLYYNWGVFSKVEYQEESLYFYDDQNNYCPIHMSYFLKNLSDETIVSKVGRNLAHLFTQMAQAAEPEKDPIKEAFDHFVELYNAAKYDEAYKCIKDIQTYNLDTYRHWLLCLGAALCAYKLCKYEEALSKYNEAVKIILDDKEDVFSAGNYVDTIDGRADTYHQLGNDLAARKDCLLTLQIATDEKDDDGALIKEKATKNFNAYEEEFVMNFLSRPYNERKVLMPVKQYTDLYQDTVNVVEVSNLPTEIAFPIGHPIANQLYIGHPLLAHKYIPFEDYQLELIEDKVREFCTIVQSLGATEISIECLNSNSVDASSNNKYQKEGHAGYKVVEGNGSIQGDNSQRLINELNHSITMHQTFTPFAAPVLPPNLVWYDSEPSWQRLYQQRMSGSLLTHEERIETRKSQLVESNEMKEIKGEIKHLIATAGGEWSDSEEAKYEMQENAVLAIHVTFAPMSQLTESATLPITIPDTPKSFINEEQEYIAEFKECLADGELGGSERRLLNKLRIKLGISEERAAELENSLLSQQLTEEEQEYLEAYQDAFDDGIISEKERRLLDKLMTMNGITAERAAELESMVQ